MIKLLTACVAAVALAGPAAAFDPPGRDPARGLPTSRDVEAVAPVLDRMVGAMMSLDVGPVMDAADPYARNPYYGSRGRTLGNLGRSRDPYFDARIRNSIYGSTAQMGRMMDAFRVAMPGMQRALGEAQRGIADAIDSYHHDVPPPPPEWDDEDYEGDWGYPDDE